MQEETIHIVTTNRERKSPYLVQTDALVAPVIPISDEKRGQGGV